MKNKKGPRKGQENQISKTSVSPQALAAKKRQDQANRARIASTMFGLIVVSSFMELRPGKMLYCVNQLRRALKTVGALPK